MGDAEEAQLNGLRDVAECATCPYLICFFHVMYNVRKRVRHLPDSVRAMVYRGILDMHYTLNQTEFWEVWGRVSQEWQCDRRLHVFLTYFAAQWIHSRFWRWQIYHSPGGYATTNNPCEVFNASIKRYTQRKAADTRRLLMKLLTIAEDYSLCVPPPMASGPNAPPQVAKQLARTLVSTNRVVVYATTEKSVVRVLYHCGDHLEDRPELSDLDELEAPSNVKTPVIISPECLTDAEKATAAKFYQEAVKWSVRRGTTLACHEAGGRCT
ncbi:hypothetical protein PHYSODRAFT_330197 [Phytophthora sojae]|uniref:MULE transposase domain-containing protein n=1 Tax=Phytophthora sojae (strain P6497) TaxID=1094619 RepID=G4Z6D9_PHYSP|nr:hypothetical protein PHYSODRAFT_330197 [Phytophthora sojae]EGZ22768.1 hypothetical protein PHYSODRAFT_330197 [Phytophthora sojae]|eukprot:XP_009525485.1 hypothetical protein PHYSODRAFT_330197 [Phytophthora sojae]